MDPITAVGFAASILTFVDFSHKIVTGTIEVFKSGKTAKNAHISEVISDLKDAAKYLEKLPPGRSGHEKALRQLSASCQELAKELTTLLAKLSTTPGHSKWTSARVALRSMRKDGKVVELESTLDKYRAQILLRLTQMVSDQQLQLQVELCDFRTQARDHGSKTLEELKSLRTELLGTIETSLRDIKQQEQTVLANPEGHDTATSDPYPISTNLDDQLKKDTPTPEMRILQQLWLDDMYVREDNIHEAEGNTFEWILDDVQGERSSSLAPQSLFFDTEAYNLRVHTRSTFQEWLRHGDNIFHISGKAGSGKSTLMKLIANDQRTYKLLDDWAGEKELVTAQFFFWRAGSDSQRTRQGLYRSLLFETLKQCPHLIQDVFPEAHRAFGKKSKENSIDQSFFRAEHIEVAFRKLVSLSSSLGCRMCLFIDGLDEYGDDGVDSYEYEKLAESLITWTKNENIKILASSRPYREFLDAFSENFRIHLHEVNAHDIQTFSRHMFKADDQFPLVKDHYEDLVWRIVYYSAGVFLWARLVTRSLIVSIHRGDPVESLNGQLEVTPKDITKLYEHFFNSISKVDQERAFKMLLILAHCKYLGSRRFNGMFLSWLDQLENLNFPMAYDMIPYEDEEIQLRHENVKRQIAGLTYGLLEMTTATEFSSSLFFGRSIQFFHRTARDFVLENSQLQRFHADHPKITDPDTYLRLDVAELWFSR
ncbi:hypothetical protein N431DRAFT_283765, partial [Stipitochalara longipes BDJ]